MTSVLKLKDIKKDWYILDISEIVLGRAAAHIATLLRGKNKATYTPFLDCGDHVIVINSDKVRLTGRKENDKTYYWHTGYPGGIKEIKAGKLRDKRSQDLVIKAVKGMLAKGPMGRKHLKNLYVYEGSEHPHQGQNPKIIDFANNNDKNSR